MADNCFWTTLAGVTQECAPSVVLPVGSLAYKDSLNKLISISPTQGGYSDHGAIEVDGTPAVVGKLFSYDEKLLAIVGSDIHQAVTLPDFTFNSTPAMILNEGYPDTSDGVFRSVDDVGSDDFYESVDGISWTNVHNWTIRVAPGYPEPLYWTKFGSRWVVCVRWNGTVGNRFMYSDNSGASWLEGTGITGDGLNFPYRIFHVGGALIAVAAQTSYNTIFRSTDGAAWSAVGAVSNPGSGSFPAANPLAYDGSNNVVFMSRDSWGNGGFRMQHSSDNGATWNTVDLPGDTNGWYQMQGVWFINGRFVLLTGGDSGSGNELVLTSTTGADGTWTTALTTPTAPFNNSVRATIIR